MKKLALIVAGIAFAAVLSLLVTSRPSPVTTPAEFEIASDTSGEKKTAGRPSSPPSNSSQGQSNSSDVDRANSDSSGTTAGAPLAKRQGDVVIGPNGQTYPLRLYRTMALPNDPGADQPWVATANMAAAWGTSPGGSQTLLAIIDTGFALDHEEFAGRWYANPDEAIDGLDDDGNGLIDDVGGWDFVNGDNSPQAQSQGRHGTYVTGVAAGTGNNSVGIAGVDWATKVLPIQVLNESGEGYNSDVANGIRYAADQGANVINLSLGSNSSDSLVREAVQYAISKGAVVVAAAGNDGCNCMVYPANYPEVVAVGATGSNGQPASFSSFGSNLDILAPGVNLYTTDWRSGSNSAYVSGISGTSLATPIVSGLLTRLKSQLPTASPLQLIAAVTETTNRLSLTSDLARSDSLGFGLLDGGLATERVIIPKTPVQRTVFAGTSFGNYLSPQSPAEVAGTATAYKCDNSRPGSTAIYELTKSGALFFSASSAEAYKASQQGYTSRLLSFTCLSMPHDRPDSSRDLSLYREFRNL